LVKGKKGKVIKDEGFYLLGYNAVKYVESQPMFLRNIPPPSSGSKNKPSKFLRKDGGDLSLRHVG
jgi:hypothetical protein